MNDIAVNYHVDDRKFLEGLKAAEASLQGLGRDWRERYAQIVREQSAAGSFGISFAMLHVPIPMPGPMARTMNFGKHVNR
jgi:hypothetical protein